MRDTTMEALRQALNYHLSGGLAMDTPKKATPEQVVTTAKKFAAFLDEIKSKRK